MTNRTATDTPTYEDVKLAEWHRDRDARMLADAMLDGTFHDSEYLLRYYRESKQAYEDVKVVWRASVDGTGR